MRERLKWVDRAVGDRIAAARRNAGITQVGLARRIDMSRASIANIEAGIQPVLVEMAFLLARELGVSPSDLIPLDTKDDTAVPVSDSVVISQVKEIAARTIEEE